MKPSIGRLVHYKLSRSDIARIDAIASSRQVGVLVSDLPLDDEQVKELQARWSAQVTGRGNNHYVGQVIPLLIVRVWPGEYAHFVPGEYDANGEWRTFEVYGPEGVNGQAFLDGDSTLWITSASQGPNVGQWMEPERVA